jgi:triosephosphate isomerase
MDNALIVNLKAYKQATGQATSHLLDLFENVEVPENASLVIAVNPVDTRLATATSLPVFAQHVDPDRHGNHTGHVIAKSVEGLGCDGILLNHSERQLSDETIKASVQRVQAATDLTTVVCAQSVDDVRSIAGLQPGAVAIEPPELIGGQTSVSTAQPELIEHGVEAAGEHDVPLYCGAGVKTTEDVRHAVDLGAQGVLVASGVVKAENPVQATERLLDGFISEQ